MAAHDLRRPPSAATFAPATSARSSPTTATVYCPSTASTRPSRRHVAASVAAAGKRGLPARRRGGSGSSRSTGATPAASRSPTRATAAARCAGSCSTASCAATASAAGCSRELVAEAERLGYEGLSARDVQRPARRRPHLPLARLRAGLGGDRPALGSRASSPTSATSSASRPAPSPSSSAERRLERAALLGQRVGDAGRRAVVDRALDQAGRLELAQAPREQPVREPGDAGA